MALSLGSALLRGEIMMVNADCTLYRYNDKTEGYDRFFIPSVYWHENKGGNTLKSGLQTVHGTTVFIYDSAFLPETPTKDILVKGNCGFKFDNTSQKTVSESFSDFRKKYSFVTVMSVDDCNFGGLPHWEITAK